MLEVYKPHTNRKAVGVWLCSAAKRPCKRSALVIIIQPKLFVTFITKTGTHVQNFDSWIMHTDKTYLG